MDRRDLLVFAAAMTASSALAQAPLDHNLPKDPNAKGLLGPLRVITIVTSDLPGMTKMYRDGMGMQLSGPAEFSIDMRQLLAIIWKIPKTSKFEIYMLRRPAVPQAAEIRLIVVDPPTPAIRKSWNRQELGPYGMGFPTLDVAAWDQHISKLGFQRATPEIERFPLKRADGSPYDVLEATFNGPEFLRNIAISRRDGMAQVGDVDPSTGRGGPSYATIVVDDMDKMVNFFTKVLDFEVRTDRIWKAYDVPFRFVTIFAKGSTHGHIALAAYDKKDVVPGTGVTPGLPNRGMVMWSFQVPTLEQIGKRVEAAGLKYDGGYSWINIPDVGERRAMMLKAPNGFIIELFERKA
jgi:catechol 2,3-dioxygenase-like lactoylglutathione lyase family enzyme